MAQELRAKVLPFIGDLGSTIEKSHYVAEASKRTGIREEAIWEDLKNPALDAKAAERAPVPKQVRGNMLSVERRVMGMIYWKPELVDFRSKVVAICSEERFLALKETTAEISEELIFETENYYEGKDIFEQDMKELLQSLERKLVQEEVDRTQTELRQIEDGGDVREILKRIQELAKRLELLKRDVSK